MGEGRRRWSVVGWGRRWRGRHRRQFPDSMWDSGKGWEKAVHMPSCVTHVTEEHLMFVECTLTYLAMDIVQWGGKGANSEGGGNRGDRGLCKAIVRLE